MNFEIAPAGIDPSAWAGSAGDTPRVGDLWLLSWNRQTLGLALVARAAASFALVWPVALPSEPIFPPAMVVPDSPLGVSLAVWPTRETGVGNHLFHRRLGELVSERSILRTMQFIEGDPVEAPFALAEPNVDEGDFHAESDAMIDRWEAICLHLWPNPSPGQTQLSRSTMERVGAGIEELIEALGLTTPDAVAMMRGERLPDLGELETLALSLEVDPIDLITAPVSDSLLSSPKFKDELVDAALELAIDEATFRNLVQQDFALAARSDGDPSAQLRAAIARVREIGRA